MADLLLDDPCLVFALRRESSAFRREFRPHQRFPSAPCWARFCGPSWLTVLVLETGAGPAAVEKALSWALGKPLLGNIAYRPKVVLSAGFCGGLQEGLRVGDVVLATEVADPEGNRWPATWPGALKGEWRPPLHRGRLLSAPRLVGGLEEKHSLGRLHDALAVDMESATVARLCGREGFPFGCVRAVSDTLDTPLSPALLGCLSGGRVSLPRLLAALIRSPRLAGEMRRLARHTRLAAGQLGLALGELLTLTLPWTEDGSPES